MSCTEGSILLFLVSVLPSTLARHVLVALLLLTTATLLLLLFLLLAPSLLLIHLAGLLLALLMLLVLHVYPPIRSVSYCCINKTNSRDCCSGACGDVALLFGFAGCCKIRIMPISAATYSRWRR
jgi:hypothetical protein